MGRKKAHTPEETVAKLRQVGVLLAQGKVAAEAVRAIGLTEATCCRWRAGFGGLELGQAKRLESRSGGTSACARRCRTRRSRRSPRRRPPRERSGPRPPPGLRRARHGEARRFGAQGLRGAGAAPLDPAQGAAGSRRRGGAHGGHRRTSRALWPVERSRARPSTPRGRPVRGEPRPLHASAWVSKASRTAFSAGVIAVGSPWSRSLRARGTRAADVPAGFGLGDRSTLR